jgi:hypothetical protein
MLTEATIDLYECDPVVPGGGRPTGPASAVADRSIYPLTAASDDVRGLLADVHLAYRPKDEYGIYLPLHITRLFAFDYPFCASLDSVAPGSGPPVRAEVRIMDGSGHVIFDSEDAEYYGAYNFGGRFRSHEWATDDTVCRIIQHTAVDDDDEIKIYSHDFAPATAVLDERCTQPLAAGVTSLTVDDSLMKLRATTQWVCGYNVQIGVAAYAAGLQTGSELTFSAVPGSGMGRFPGCESTDSIIRSINQVPGTADGAFALAAKDCFWVRPKLVSDGGHIAVVPNTLEFGDDCNPCLKCEDLEETQIALLKLFAKWEVIESGRRYALDLYKLNIDRWTAQKACREKIYPRIEAVAYDGNKVSVTSGICNRSEGCLTDVTVRVRAEVVGGSASLEFAQANAYRYSPGVGVAPYTPDGEAMDFTSRFDSVSPGLGPIVRVQFRITPDVLPVVVRFTATALAGEVELPGTASKSVSLGAWA